jgi:hypothetical protein
MSVTAPRETPPSEFSGWRKHQTAKRGCSPPAARWTRPSRMAIVSPTARATTKPGITGAATGLWITSCAPWCGRTNTKTGRAAASSLTGRAICSSFTPIASSGHRQRSRASKPNFICRRSAPRSKATGTIRAQRRRTCHRQEPCSKTIARTTLIETNSVERDRVDLAPSFRTIVRHPCRAAVA